MQKRERQKVATAIINVGGIMSHFVIFCKVLRTHAPYYLADINCICPIKTHVRTFSQVFIIQQRHIMMNNAAPHARSWLSFAGDEYNIVVMMEVRHRVIVPPSINA
jgi:hypothetical protein